MTCYSSSLWHPNICMNSAPGCTWVLAGSRKLVTLQSTAAVVLLTSSMTSQLNTLSSCAHRHKGMAFSNPASVIIKRVYASTPRRDSVWHWKHSAGEAQGGAYHELLFRSLAFQSRFGQLHSLRDTVSIRWSHLIYRYKSQVTDFTAPQKKTNSFTVSKTSFRFNSL